MGSEMCIRDRVRVRRAVEDNPAARFMVQRLHAIAAEEAEKV